HTVAVRDPSKQFVRVFKLAGAAIRIAEDKLWKTDDRADGRIRVSSARDGREIASARILSRHRQTIRIQKVRMHSAKLHCAPIHYLGKCVDTTGIVSRKTTCNVIGTFHQQGP